MIGLGEVNRLGRERFVATFGAVFEASPWVAALAWRAQPFGSLEHLHGELCGVARRASEAEILALIRAHPDLVDRAALAGHFGPASAREQAAAGLDQLSAEETEVFAQLNRAYRAKFGFPFVVCARENRKAAILKALAARLGHSRDVEIATALEEIDRIAWLRLVDLVAPGSGSAVPEGA